MNYATPHGRRDTVDQSDLERRLSQYAADPESVGITDTDALMSHCLELLAAQKTDNFGHWFCHRAPTVVIEAATFLIRLHAYANEHVERWKKDMIAVLHSCCDCGRGYENAKKKAKTT
jgi:senataxin